MTGDFGTLTDYATGEAIRAATAAEWRRTADAIASGTPQGTFDLDGRAVWVEFGPDPEVGFYDIAALRDEAGQAGDMGQVRICNTALDEEAGGYDEARAECVRVILDNRADSVA